MKGYIRAHKVNQVTDFIVKSGVAKNNVVVDLTDSQGNTSSQKVFREFLNTLQEGDILVIKSLENAFSGDFNEFCETLEVCRKKSVKLNILEEDGILNHLTEGTVDAINMVVALKRLVNFGVNRVTYNEDKGVRKANNYPDNFYQVHSDYRAGNISLNEAVKLAQVTQRTFYNLLNRFEG